MFNAIDVLDPSFTKQKPTHLWNLISPLYNVDEADWLTQLLPLAKPSTSMLKTTTDKATALIKAVREDDEASSMIDSLLLEYSLDTKEGILLMCLAEALMRVPDGETADAFIRDRLSSADWNSHLKNSDSFFVNASTWGLMLTGKVVGMNEKEDGSPANLMNRMVNRLSEPVIRKAMYQAMKIMGHQFVLGRSIKEALSRGKSYRDKGYSYSFDMLGEAALTQEDADKYLSAYMSAIDSVAKDDYKGNAPSPTISIKLSALHPRYEIAQEARVMSELFDSVKQLIIKARNKNVGITIDAEEADRLELSLSLFEKLYQDPVSHGWGQFGLVIQAYSKRALPVLTWLTAIAAEQGDQIPVRLVKGAYWDAEIKLCQQKGFDGYPVYTRKEATDMSYLACAHFLLSDHARQWIFPQFATHNAHTIAAISALATQTGAPVSDYEFQRLHGMGDALYNRVIKDQAVNVRIYAPVGSHKDLLPYLVRRLLENGANSSFVHRLVDAKCPIEELTHHPVETLLSRKTLANPYIKLPIDMFEERKNSFSPNIEISSQWLPFEQSINQFMQNKWQACPIVSGIKISTEVQHLVRSPYDQSQIVGELNWAQAEHVTQAISDAEKAFTSWSAKSMTERAACLLKMADLLEQNLPELVAICHKEAGKTIQDSIDEVREAVDFCRYYGCFSQDKFEQAKTFTDFRGQQQNQTFEARGVFACISPWNFPLAIFLGQVTAALVVGNTVVAKPAEQTCLIAMRAVELLFEAGIPTDVLHLLPGDGATVGNTITSDKRIAGLAFTGSTATAQRINRSLAARGVDPVPLIAETGGQNAMIVDSTALPEQVVRDAVNSAFSSAGQRCSALRVLFVQADIADRVVTMLQGAMQELVVGEPQFHSTDLGPVIDKTAQDKLSAHIDAMVKDAKLIGQTTLSEACNKGTFIAPTAFELSSIKQLGDEQFGPILHLIRYQANTLESIIEDINNSGFGLTMGVHSRNETTCNRIAELARVGNLYINRDQIGAVVGVQPFGGQGLSGTGPKAGGPHYLAAFMK
jgi:RHH-type proline utilization regulon transcriptional repressor/proline dehydrogenase/delta 1-pyrroline-5-carboxylate dehydrogenase